jgi:hypothetical protein
MAEEVTQITRPSPIIEEAQKNYLTSLKDQVGTALDTSQFAPSVVGKTALDQAIQQQQAKAAGLGELQFDQTGAVTGIGQDGVASFQPFLDTAQTTLGGVQPFIDAAGTQFGKQAGFMGPTACRINIWFSKSTIRFSYGCARPTSTSVWFRSKFSRTRFSV